MASCLSQLPQELLHYVLDYIRKPKDLIAFALTSRRFRSMALARAWHNLDLNISVAENGFDVDRIFYRNPNLIYVRKVHLTFPLSGEIPGPESELRLNEQFWWIVAQLPEGTIEEFTWTVCLSKVSSENVKYLVARQENLKRLQVSGDQALEFSTSSDESPKRVLANCRNLHILRAATNKSLNAGLSLLPHLQHIEGLRLEDSYGRDYTSPTIDCVANAKVLFDAVFQNLRRLPATDEAFVLPNLTSLQLIDMELLERARDWMNTIDMRKLKTLIFRRCSGTPAIVAGLAEIAIDLRLERLEVTHSHKQEDGDDCIASIDKLFRHNLELQHLSIQLLYVTSSFKFEGLLRNIGSLKTLRMHSMSDYELYPDVVTTMWTDSQFSQLCSCAMNLTQLSCCFPMTKLLKDASLDWNQYSRSAVSIPNLVTLHIINFPADYTSDETSERRYLTLIKEYANDIFLTTRVRYNAGTMSLVEVPKPWPLRYVGFGSAPDRIFYERPLQVVYTQGEVRIGDEIREMVTVEVDEDYRDREGGPNCWLLDEPLSFLSRSSLDDPDH